VKLVLVHGRSQGGQNAAALKKHWLDALAYGFERAGCAMPSGTVVELPFYGDRLDQLVAQANAPLTLNIAARGTASDKDGTLRGEILRDFAANAGLKDADIARELGDGPQEKGPQNWTWVLATVRALDRVPGLNAELVDLITRDVYAYLTFPAIRRVIDTLVASSMESEACIVVGHSLGSIVAYNVLCDRAAAPPYPRYITVGSPLGIRAIQRHLSPPLRSPACVTHWFNAYDPHDIVALRALDAHAFDVTPPIENKVDISNFTENRHSIEGYLADPVVAARIAEYL
jgi:hypothetical protein